LTPDQIDVLSPQLLPELADEDVDDLVIWLLIVILLNRIDSFHEIFTVPQSRVHQHRQQELSFLSRQLDQLTVYNALTMPILRQRHAYHHNPRRLDEGYAAPVRLRDLIRRR
jgi:hypothetical protein